MKGCHIYKVQKYPEPYILLSNSHQQNVHRIIHYLLPFLHMLMSQSMILNTLDAFIDFDELRSIYVYEIIFNAKSSSYFVTFEKQPFGIPGIL